MRHTTHKRIVYCIVGVYILSFIISYKHHFYNSSLPVSNDQPSHSLGKLYNLCCFPRKAIYLSRYNSNSKYVIIQISFFFLIRVQGNNNNTWKNGSSDRFTTFSITKEKTSLGSSIHPTSQRHQTYCWSICTFLLAHT